MILNPSVIGETSSGMLETENVNECQIKDYLNVELQIKD